MDPNVIQLAGLLQQSVSSPVATERRAAEESVLRVQSQPGFASALMTIVGASANLDASVRQVAAILLKNFIKTRWNPKSDGLQEGIGPEEKQAVRASIVGHMLASPANIRKQLSEAISIISAVDFPAQWPTLVSDLVAKLAAFAAAQDVNGIIGVLETVSAIFEKYQHQSKTNGLLVEIKGVLDVWQVPMLHLFVGVCDRIFQQPGGDPAQIRTNFEAVNLLLRIFYSLNFQDLPEFFEDHMRDYFDKFHLILKFKNDAIDAEADEETPTVINVAKTLVCECINLYMEKYEEEFEPFLKEFAADMWKLPATLGPQVRNDQLVCAAIHSLTTVSRSVHHILFAAQNIQLVLCEDVIVPNLYLRDDDIELFDNDPVQYVRKDVEGSDFETRRRAASELVKGLCENYEGPVIQILSTYVNKMLQIYSSNKKLEWKSKDAAIYLITALAVKSKTAAGGTTAVRELVPVAQFFASEILPVLQNLTDMDEEPILKADCIKFVLTFRQQISKQAFSEQIFIPLFSYIRSRHRVVQTYAAMLLERALVIKDPPSNVPRFNKDDFKLILVPLLTALFSALCAASASQENEYLMRAFLRVCTVAQDGMGLYLGQILQNLTVILDEVCKNPANPDFNHYLFESFAALIRYNHDTSDKMAFFEEKLFPIFQTILQKDIQEFTPYVFQLLSQMLEIRASQVPPSYITIFSPLLTPVLWEKQGNVPALARLVTAYFSNCAIQVKQHLLSVLGVFQKLVSNSSTDHEGLSILDAIIAHIPLQDFEIHLQQILAVLFHRLQNTKPSATKFRLCLILFFSLFIVKHGGQFLIEKTDAMQQGLFDGLLDLLLPEVSKINGLSERKLVSVALTDLLFKTPVMTNSLARWENVFIAQIKLLELPQEQLIDSELANGEDPYAEFAGGQHENGGIFTGKVFTNVFSQLHFSTNKQTEDPTSHVQDAKQYFQASMDASMRASPIIAKTVMDIKAKWRF